MFKCLTRSPLTVLVLTLMMASIAQAQLVVKNSAQSEILRITTTGNLGIMTTNPSSRLAVNGGLNIGPYYPPAWYNNRSKLIVQGNVGIGITEPGSYALYVGSGTARFNNLYINWEYSFPTAIGTTNEYLNGLGQWGTLPADGDGVLGNEITTVTNTTLTRSGSGTAVAPYTAGLNLANANTWTAEQTFSAGANFSTSTNTGTWNSAGNLGAGVANPGSRLSVNSSATIGSKYVAVTAPANGLLVEGIVGINTTVPIAQLYSYTTPGVDAVNVSILGESHTTNDNYNTMAIIGSINYPTSTVGSNLSRASVNTGLAGDVTNTSNKHYVVQGNLGLFQANSPWSGWQDPEGTLRDLMVGLFGGVKPMNEGGTWGPVAVNARRVAVLGINNNTGAKDYGLIAMGPRHYINGQLLVRGETWNDSGIAYWMTYSDRSLKDVDGAFGKGLKEIMALQPIRYHFKTDNDLQLPSDQEHSGFIAQDVDKVIPEAVQRHESGYLAMNYDPILLSLVNAVKELKAKNNKLRAEIQKMQNQ